MNRGGKLSAEVNRALSVATDMADRPHSKHRRSIRTLWEVRPHPVRPPSVTRHHPSPAATDVSLNRQIRQGIANATKGTAFVVYEDVMDAKAACDKLNGFNFQKRYLVVLYHQQSKANKAHLDLAERQENLEKLKQEHGIA
nr:splicing factor 3b subunit 6-like protein [Quercus suber]